MKELLELRVREEFAARVFGPGDGVVLQPSGLVRKVMLPLDDPRVAEIARIDAELATRTPPASLYAGCQIHRRYTAKEIAAAELFRIEITAAFEPAGEECGTTYDWTSACAVCRAGRSLVGPLRLRVGRIPKGADIARTISRDEWVVSQRLAELFVRERVRGASLSLVHPPRGAELDLDSLASDADGRALVDEGHDAVGDALSSALWVWLFAEERRQRLHAALVRIGNATLAGRPAWYRLQIDSTPLAVDLTTRTGITPTDHDAAGKYVCPCGDTIALNLISELRVRGGDAAADVLRTREYFGYQMGLLVPAPEIVVSARLFALMREHGARGFRWDVARRDAD